MKNLKITVSAMMVIMSISGMSASFRFFKKKNNDDNKPAATVPALSKVTSSNPASDYCTKQGGKSIIVKSSKGDYGVCMLKDGTAMEEWEYYRQNNTPRNTEAAVIGMPNPASKFCVDKGGKSVTEKDNNGNERGVCRFNNGTKVDEWDYYRENN